MPLTPADVRNKQFSTTRLRPGYDEEEVDAFLDEVEVELDRLIQENEELRSKLAECLRGGKSAVSALSSPLADPEPEMLAHQLALLMDGAIVAAMVSRDPGVADTAGLAAGSLFMPSKLKKPKRAGPAPAQLMAV